VKKVSIDNQRQNQLFDSPILPLHKAFSLQKPLTAVAAWTKGLRRCGTGPLLVASARVASPCCAGGSG
jgi:hypothetical protein